MNPAGTLATISLLVLSGAPALAADSGAERSFTSLGLAAAYVPRYEGADEYRWRALPLIDIQRGRYFLGTLRGLGVDLSSSPNFAFGPRLGYRFGRDEGDSSRLRGLGDIDAGLEAGVFFRLRLDSWFIRGDVAQGIGDAADGLEVQLGGGRRMKFGPADDVVVEATLSFADSDYNNTFYGVTAAQAAASGLSRYEAGAGLRHYGLGANWTHRFAGGWFSSLGVRVRQLGGDVADSPIVDNETQVSMFAGLGYRF